MAISLEDVTLHSGWLQVWSMPGEGACFRLTLPRVTGKGIISSPLPLPPVDAGAKPGRRAEATTIDSAAIASSGSENIDDGVVRPGSEARA